MNRQYEVWERKSYAYVLCSNSRMSLGEALMWKKLSPGVWITPVIYWYEAFEPEE